MWHSCSSYDIEQHFEHCEPHVRETFDVFLAVVEACGPVEVIPQKSRIAIQAEVRFAGCVVRRKWLLANLWLTRRAAHPALQRIEEFGPRSYGHQFRLDSPEGVDDRLRRLVQEAYQVGLRHHLQR
jgi:hypothetical protein